jgi:hypothetical protein
MILTALMIIAMILIARYGSPKRPLPTSVRWLWRAAQTFAFICLLALRGGGPHEWREAVLMFGLPIVLYALALIFTLKAQTAPPVASAAGTAPQQTQTGNP